MKILVVGEIHPEALALLEEKAELIKVSDEEFTSADKYDVEAIVLRTYTVLQKEQLAKLPHLKYVISCSVGFDNINMDALNERSIEFIRVSGTNSNSVAEHTMFLLLSLLRQDPRKPPLELKGKTVGIVGLGHIGKVVATKLQGFDSKIIAFDVIEQDPKLLKELKVEMKPFDKVVSESDIITVHVPLNEHTKHLINNDAFTKMKQNIFLINTSRVEVVDETALIQNQQKLRGIALDVFSDQLKSQLTTYHILTNHQGAQGENSLRNMCVKPVEVFLQKL
jgi:lactate dehydrogenase-like 2-hydroxyacid dehydrogenase